MGTSMWPWAAAAGIFAALFFDESRGSHADGYQDNPERSDAEVMRELMEKFAEIEAKLMAQGYSKEEAGKRAGQIIDRSLGLNKGKTNPGPLLGGVALLSPGFGIVNPARFTFRPHKGERWDWDVLDRGRVINSITGSRTQAENVVHALNHPSSAGTSEADEVAAGIRKHRNNPKRSHGRKYEKRVTHDLHYRHGAWWVRESGFGTHDYIAGPFADKAKADRELAAIIKERGA